MAAGSVAYWDLSLHAVTAMMMLNSLGYLCMMDYSVEVAAFVDS